MLEKRFDIKIGQRFHFLARGSRGSAQEGVVTKVLSNGEEGLGKELDFYIADWIEAKTLSATPQTLVFGLGLDNQVYLEGKPVDITLE